MAPKRAAAAIIPESSSSGSDDEVASGTASSSSEEEEPQRKEEVRSPLSSHKKTPVAPAPPVQSSDEEEEDGSSEEEEGDASEEEEEDDSGEEDPKSSGLQTTKGQPLPAPETLPKPTSDESSDGSGSDSESSDESPPPSVPAPRPSRAAEPSIKPITTKPMDGPSNPVNQVSSSPSPDQGSLKRKRESVGSPQAAQKRQSFQRVWGLDDELILLNGMAEFRSKNGYAPSSNHEMEAIRELIKDSFRLVVSDNQLLDKIRRLKKKFLTNAARAKNDADPVLSNAHEQDAYTISKKVWGSNKFTSVNGNGNASVNSESEGNEEERGNEIGQKSKDDANCTENGSIVKRAHYPFLWETANKMADELPCGVGIKMALEMLDNAKAKALEDKLEKLIMSKTRIHMRRINLSKETVKLLLDSVAKSE